MSSSGRRCNSTPSAVTWLVALVIASGVTGDEPVSTPTEMLDDAELTAVQFLDPDLGWAVGDRGVILRTEDGGRNWELQRSPVDCRLTAVNFVDAQCGWIVGGEVLPYSRRTKGVVLRTQDGGRSWSVIPGLTLPSLKGVRFLNAHQGWSVGGASTLYPAGIFRTDDAGRSWSTLPSGVRGGWLAAEFRDFQQGIVVGEGGQVARVSAPAVEAVTMTDAGHRPWRAVSMAPDHRGWLVGDGGSVRQTLDAGLTWQAPPGALPRGVAEHFDYQSLAVVGNHIWVVGLPGTCVLHSPDGGQRWELRPTGQSLPLRAITFVDTERGWAVGALGTVLGTRDGGRSWRRLRGGGTRLALLGVFSEPRRVPWGLFTWESGNEGYFGAVELLNQRERTHTSMADAAVEDAARAAMTVVGGNSVDCAWQFPLPETGMKLGTAALIERWDRVVGGRSIDSLEELVVRKIRQWRPDVIVTEPARPQGDNPLSHLVNQIVISAVRNAADPQAYPDHAASAGLQPWSVKKVFSVAEGDEPPTVTLATAQLATRLSCSIADRAAEANAKILPRYEPVPASLGFSLLHDELPQATGRRDIFSGIFAPPGGESRRTLGAAVLRDIEPLRLAAQKRRNIEQIFASSVGASSQSAGWLGQIQDLTKSLGNESAGQVLYQLGQRYLEAGELELAAQSFEQLVERYPHHGLAETALVWLIHYYASSEVAWQLDRRRHVPTHSTGGQLAGPPPATGVDRAVFDQPLGTAPVAAGMQTGFSPREATATDRFGSTLQDRSARALHLAKIVQRGRPELFAEPSVQFPTAVAFRHQGIPREAERLYHRLGASPFPTAWSGCATAELWFEQGRGKSPKPVCRIPFVSSRPRLDGQLSDDTWRTTEPLPLVTADDDTAWPASVMLACDDEFLLIAVNCRKAPSAQYPSTPGARLRDTPLDDRDRVDLLIDLDRDYVSYYRLTVDHRGWTGEACLENPAWDPQWYVASHETADDWTVEAAIPWSELTPQPPRPGDVWAVGVQRIVPGTCLQSFTQPAAVDPRGEGFALMMFH